MSPCRLRLLWIKTGLLHPLDTGGKLRTYNMLRELKKRHQVTFLTLKSSRTPSDCEEKANEYCHELIAMPWEETPKFTWAFYAELARNLIFSNLPYAIEKYRSPMIAKEIRELSEKRYDLIVSDFLSPAVNINGAIDIPILLFQHNVESQIWRRHYEAATEFPKRHYFWVQWKRMAAFEKYSCSRCDGVVTVSSQDSKTLSQEFSLTNILGDVPTGVDTDYFHPLGEGLKKPGHLVFTGSMDWLPNEDAVLYFVKNIYPLIKATIPDITFTVAGRKPSKIVSALQGLDSSIHVTGTVEDIRPYIAAATAIVVPLRIGGGTRIKIFEGMGMGIPIVSTTVGAEGLPVFHGENILLADTPDDFARETTRLLKNPSKARDISKSALKMVRKRYSWDAVSRVFESYCLKLLERYSGDKDEN